jgi:hypothetical protein
MPVQFDEQEFSQPSQIQHSSGGQGGVTHIIMKLGLAKSVAQANVVMLIIAVVASGLAIYFALPHRAPAPTPVMPTTPQGLTEGGP